MLFAGGSRWHLNEKFILIHIRVVQVVINLENIPRVFLLNILDSTSSLDTTHRKARLVWEATDNSCLPLQWTLESLVKLCRLVQTDDIDIAIRGANHQKFSLHIHGVNSLLALYCSYRCLLSQVPVLYGFVPRTSNQHLSSCAWNIAPSCGADRLVVGSYLCCSILTSSQIDNSCRLVCSCSNNLIAFLASLLAIRHQILDRRSVLMTSDSSTQELRIQRTPCLQ
jgi:hypothetical protein